MPRHPGKQNSLDAGWMVRETGHVQRLVAVLNSYGAWIVAAAFSVSGVSHLLTQRVHSDRAALPPLFDRIGVRERSG
jgi:hypothetical protein